METESFESWAILEIFGHTQIAGKVTEASIGGCSFLRVDVPEHEGKPAFTKFYGQGAVYSMTPCSEEAARAALKHIMPAPVSVWMPELKEIPAPNAAEYKNTGEPFCDDCGRSAENCDCDMDADELP